MSDPQPSLPRIDDPAFRQAVQLMDAGAVDELRQLLEERPQLLRMTAAEDGQFAGDYFAHPRLLWFVAENPIRTGRLPDNVVAVIEVIATASREAEVSDLTDVLNRTLALVASGNVPRQSGQQAGMCRALVAAGADPNSGMQSSLAHRETQACEVLLQCGADLTLPVAAGLGRDQDVTRLLAEATDTTRQEALIMAAVNGQHRCARILADNGTDLNAFNPPGLHAHSTPLHQAVASGDASTVCALLTRGADPTIRDRLFAGDAMGWACEFGHTNIQDLLQQAAVMMVAVTAIRCGDIERLTQWLQQHAARVNEIIGDNPRTLLHYATDWPGHWPRVAQTVSLLVAAGADVNARCHGPATSAQETPLHWAASSDDVAAADTLISSGAELNVDGGCIGNGTQLALAVIFQNWQVAERLVEAGCQLSLPLVAGMGRMDLVRRFFDDSGVRSPHPKLAEANDQTPADDARDQLNQGAVLAASGGHLQVLKFLLRQGAPLNAVSGVQTTSLDEAIARGHADVAEYLKSCGAVGYAELPKGSRE